MRPLPRLRVFLPLTLWALAACSDHSLPLAPEPSSEPSSVPEPFASSFAPNDVDVAHLVPTGKSCLLLSEAGQPSASAVASEHGLTILESFGNHRLLLVEGVLDAPALEQDPRVEAYQADGFTALSRPVELTMSFYEGDVTGGVPQQQSLGSLRLPSVHRLATGRGVKVAVLDTGIDPTHPLFAHRLELIPAGSSHLSSREIALGVDTDGDGVPDEAFGHGTHVAGLIATVAPDATILPIRVLDSDGVGSAFELAMGMLYAVDHGARIINLSLVLSNETKVIERVLRDLDEQGVVVVGAGGNRPGPVLFPASDSHVVGVAALTPGETLASFSAGDGARLAAPGETLISAYPGGRWSSATGTSMSSAVVSGAIAVVSEVAGSPYHADELLHETATQIAQLGEAEINLLTAVRIASGYVGPRRQLHQSP